MFLAHAFVCLNRFLIIRVSGPTEPAATGAAQERQRIAGARLVQRPAEAGQRHATRRGIPDAEERQERREAATERRRRLAAASAAEGLRAAGTVAAAEGRRSSR